MLASPQLRADARRTHLARLAAPRRRCSLRAGREHPPEANEPRWLGHGDPHGYSTDDDHDDDVELHYGQWEGLSPESASLAFTTETELAHGEALHKELQDLKAGEKGLAHRWVVVIAMVAAFVLCNMDKVCMASLATCFCFTG
jgi:hypothetical protein